MRPNDEEAANHGSLEEQLIQKADQTEPSSSYMDSLDYDIIMNDTLKQDWRAKTKDEIFQYVMMKWAFSFVVGLVTGLIALLLNVAIENLAGHKLLLITGFMEARRYWLAFAIFTATNVGLVLFSSTICTYIAPGAAGSGIPEIKAYLNGVDAPAVMGIKIIFIKILGSIAATSAGLYLEREGPLIHIGACVAYVMGLGGSRRFGLTCKWVRFFKNDRDRRDLVTCGVAAGVTAAFRAPVGGVLFALEEAVSWWRSALLWRSFFTTATVAVVLRLGRDLCKHGKCGLFGDGGLIMFDVSDGKAFMGVADLVPVILLGATGGILGSLFNKLNSRVCIFYTHWLYKKGKVMKVLQACILATITSMCCFGLPLLAPCRACPDLNGLPYTCPSFGKLGNFKNFNCPDGQYNDLAGLFFATKDDAVQNIFSTNTTKEYHYASLFIFLVASYALTVVTYGTTVPSGLFIPIILIGATFGRMVGMTMSTTYYKAIKSKEMDEGIYAVLGATALLGGSMRMTVALCIIMLEVTNNLALLPLLMLVLLISKAVGDLFSMAIYALFVHLKEFPILLPHPHPFMHHLTAKDAISSPLLHFPVIHNVGLIYKALCNTKHNAFPVVSVLPFSKNPIFAGLVLRSHLLILLKNKVFQNSKEEQSSYIKMEAFDFAKPASGKGLRIEDICLSKEEQEMYIDLRPITNTSAYTVLENISLAKAYTLFRQLGLRHLCVLPLTVKEEPVIGILTRHDFMLDRLLKYHPDVVEPSILISTKNNIY